MATKNVTLYSMTGTFRDIDNDILVLTENVEVPDDQDYIIDFNFNLETSSLSNGDHSLYLYSLDDSGNGVYSDIINISISGISTVQGYGYDYGSNYGEQL